MRGNPSTRARRIALRGALAAGVAVAVATGGAVAYGTAALGTAALGTAAHGTAARSVAAAKPPAGRAGELTAVAVVPHSTQVWVVDSAGSTDNADYLLAHGHGGHWQKVKAPQLGGRCGQVNTVAAGSAKAVWLGGATQLSCHTGQIVSTAPAIWKLKGNKFVAAKLPKLDAANSSAVSSIAASSATNAWAVGGFYPGATAAQEAFHWNGKSWSAVAVPTGYAEGLYDVSTSGPSNAWALQSEISLQQTSLVHWNGKAWSVVVTEPAGMTLNSVATSSAKLAYAVGTIYDSTTGGNKSVILRFDGKTWSRVSVPKAGAHSNLVGVALHGHSVWVVGDVRTVLLHSTGGRWKVEKSPGSSYQLLAVAAASSKRAYAVGWHARPGTSSATTYFAALSGSSWKGEPSTF